MLSILKALRNAPGTRISTRLHLSEQATRHYSAPPVNSPVPIKSNVSGIGVGVASTLIACGLMNRHYKAESSSEKTREDTSFVKMGQ